MPKKLSIAACLALLTTPAFAQVPPNRIQESFTLAAANVALSTGYYVYGGTYILSQLCSAYGTLAFQVAAADGSWQTLNSKTASDTVGGTSISLAAQSNVRALLTGTTGCVATLTRVPN